MSIESKSTDYVLGTEQDELQRLERQHKVWRKLCQDVWSEVGITSGSSVLDVGAGPGFASFDLATMVGSTGRVVALERSQNFLDYLHKQKEIQNLKQLAIHSVDLMTDQLPVTGFDFTWCRWVCTFLRDPKVLIEKIHRALKPGGVAVFHEYVNYDSWRMLPDSLEVKEFVDRVKETWRKENCEANVAPVVVKSLLECGYKVKTMRPLHYSAAPHSEYWKWLTDYMRVNTERMLKQGLLPRAKGDALMEVLKAAEGLRDSFMLTPTVLEVIAVKR